MTQQTQAVTVFNFEENEIRTTIVDGRIWFVAADVCKALGITKVAQAVNGNPSRDEDGLDEDERGYYIVSTLGGNQSMLCINESGLQELIWKSRKPNAKKFKRWIKREVVPAIASTGIYDPQGQIELLQQEIAQLRTQATLQLPERVESFKQAITELDRLQTFVKEAPNADNFSYRIRSNLEFCLKKAQTYFQGGTLKHFDLNDKADEYGNIHPHEYPPD